jgi:arylsulfatase
MECFAAFLSHADEQIGRVLSFIETLGEADDTLVVLVSDNGASAEGGALGSINDARLWNGAPAGRRELRARLDELGGPTAHNNYPWGWTMAGNTPFRRWKREVHEGGVADPCIVRWPRRLAGPNGAGGGGAGEIRHQFAHAIDVLPTVLELAGISAPSSIGGVEQSPIEGTSFAYALAADGAGAEGRHRTQYFEMFGSRAIYHDGWKAVTFKPLGPMYDDGLDPEAPFDSDVWELYHVAVDLSECDDLATKEPDQLASLVELWQREAEAHQVLPLDNRPVAALMSPRRPPDARTRYVFWPGETIVPETVTVNVRNRPHRITAEVDMDDSPDGEPAHGVLLALGTALGGWSLHVFDGRLRYVNNYLGKERHALSSEAVIPAGRHRLGFTFSTDGDFRGTGRLFIDVQIVGEAEIPRITPVRHSLTGGGVTCGWEQGPAVGADYEAPFRFNRVLHRVVVGVTGVGHRDPSAEFEAIMSEQ